MKNVSWLDNIFIHCATICGIGYTPLCPGTAASVAAVVVFMSLRNPLLYAFFTLAVLILSFISASRAETIFKEKDCKKIVIDDFVGMLISFLFIPFSYKFMIIGFFLFRMFDMLKVPPADKFEQLPGGWGVVMDDIVAGVYANCTLQITALVFSTLIPLRGG